MRDDGNTPAVVHTHTHTHTLRQCDLHLSLFPCITPPPKLPGLSQWFEGSGKLLPEVVLLWKSSCSPFWRGVGRRLMVGALWWRRMMWAGLCRVPPLARDKLSCDLLRVRCFHGNVAETPETLQVDWDGNQMRGRATLTVTSLRFWPITAVWTPLRSDWSEPTRLTRTWDGSSRHLRTKEGVAEVWVLEVEVLPVTRTSLFVWRVCAKSCKHRLFPSVSSGEAPTSIKFLCSLGNVLGSGLGLAIAEFQTRDPDDAQNSDGGSEVDFSGSNQSKIDHSE